MAMQRGNVFPNGRPPVRGIGHHEFGVPVHCRGGCRGGCRGRGAPNEGIARPARANAVAVRGLAPAVRLDNSGIKVVEDGGAVEALEGGPDGELLDT